MRVSLINDFDVKSVMSLLDARIRQWVKRHPYRTLMLSGVAVLVIGYSVVFYLSARSHEIFLTLPENDPNWLYYRDGGEALFAGLVTLILGGGLLLSPVFALGQSVADVLNQLKLKGSHVE